METLPHELIDIVAELLPISSVKNLRLVHRRLSNCLVSRLFQSVDARVNIPSEASFDPVEAEISSATANGATRMPKELRGLLRIAGSPNIAQHVRFLRLGLGCGFVDFDYSGDYLTPLQKCFRFHVGSHIWNYLNRLGRALSFVLPRLENVMDVQLYGTCLYGEGLAERLCPRRWATLMGSISRSVLTHFARPDHLGRLQSLRHSVPSMGYLQLYSETFPSGIGFSKLKRLHLDIDRADRGDESAPIRSLILGTERLQTFTLTIGDPDGHTLPLDIDSLFRQPLEHLHLTGVSLVTSSNLYRANSTGTQPVQARGQGALRTLRLCNIRNLSSEQLVALLALNAQTLNEVELTWIELASGTWTSAFTYMLDHLPRLTACHAEYLSYDNSRESSSSDLESTTSSQYEFEVATWDMNPGVMRGRDLTENGVLHHLCDVVAARAAACRIALSGPDGNEQAAVVFGPQKRQWTLLDRWLGLPAM